jgi:hypothetical protein
VRRIAPWTLVGLFVVGAGVAAIVGGLERTSQSGSGGVTRNLVSPFYLTGLPLRVAEALVHQDHMKLSVLLAPSEKPRGQVISEDPNLQKDQTIVVSSGPLKNRLATLPPASVPPVAAECAGGLQLAEDGTVGPLLCHGGVNVGAWRWFRTMPLLSLGRGATRAQVIQAICSSPGTPQMAEDAYELAASYYGWSFSPHLADEYLGELHGRTCTSATNSP